MITMFKYVLLYRSYEYLTISDQQFCSKRHHSAVQCTFLVNETISYFNSMNLDVFCCRLDCTKAFDRVSVRTMFIKLFNTAISAILLRRHFHTYSHNLL